MSTELEGILRLSRWSTYVGSDQALKWLEDRIKDMPDGAYVRITAEVLDPHPPESREPEYECEKCKDRMHISIHDPSADGHGGANGGAWVAYHCPDCNPLGVKKRFPFIHYGG